MRPVTQRLRWAIVRGHCGWNVGFPSRLVRLTNIISLGDDAGGPHCFPLAGAFADAGGLARAGA